jgi:P pilus assembly chaperone PapD
MPATIRMTSPRQGPVRSLWLPLALAAVTALSSRTAGAQVAVDELEVHINLSRTTTSHQRTIPVRNDDSTAHQVRIVVGDWTRDTLGMNVFPEATGTSRSCGTRLQVFPATLQIAARSTEYVRVSYEAAPADTGCWAIAYVETVKPPPPRPDGQGSFLTIEVRTGVKIYVHRPDPVSLGEVRDIRIEAVRRPPARGAASRDSSTVHETAVWFQNTGTAHLRVKNSLEIRSSTGTLLHTIPGPEAYMTPGSLRVIRVAMPALQAGDYVAILLLDYGGDEIAAAQSEFRIP